MAHISQRQIVQQIQAEKDENLLNKFTSQAHFIQLSERENEKFVP
jgi:hypothetical protein